MGWFSKFKKNRSEDIEENYIDSYDEDDDEYEDEALDVYEAAEIWACNGMDEDYTFGYSEEELQEALHS